MDNRYLVLVVALLVTLATLGQGQGDAEGRCTFPEKLTSRSRWETQVMKEHRRTNKFYKFHANTLEVQVYGAEEKHMVTYSCLEERTEKMEKTAITEKPDLTYVLKFEEEGTEKFVCMQFVHRSSRVLQQRVSRVWMEFRDDICDSLEVDPWPLVWPNMDGKYSECPFEGGYQINLKEYMSDEDLCDSDWLKPRLESECIKGEGITIDFRIFECRGELGMRLQQKLMCLGTWQDGEYVFTILTDNDDLWPKLWLMRLPKQPREDSLIRGVLSKDILADHGEYYGSDGRVPLERVYEMTMTTEVYPSLCENEAQECDSNMCGGGNEMYCQRSCGACEPSLALKTCKFGEMMRGEWQEFHDNGVRDITVTDSLLYADDLMPFQCYELYTEMLYEGRKAMVTIFKNGCKPRFTCVEFEQKASEVVGYRLSQSLVWPATHDVTGGKVCADEQFDKDPEPLTDKYRSKDKKILVRKNTGASAQPEAGARTQKRETVQCGVETSMGLSGLANDGRKLLGVLWSSVIGSEGQTPGESHTLLHETCPGDATTDSEPTSHSSRRLRCLASYHPRNDTHFLVVESDEEVDEEGAVECWVIHTYLWESNPRAMVLSPAHCNPTMPMRVDFANNTHFLSRYEAIELDPSEMNPCLKWKTDSPKPLTDPQITIAPTRQPPKAPLLTPIGPDPTSTVRIDVTPVDKIAPDDWKIKVGGRTSGQSRVVGQFGLGIILWLLVQLF